MTGNRSLRVRTWAVSLLALLAIVSVGANQAWASPGAWVASPSGTSEMFTGVRFVNPSTGWAFGTGDILLRTTDGGDTWSRQSVGLPSPPPYPAGVNLIGADFVDEDYGWVLGNGPDATPIARTMDGGKTWASVPGPWYGSYHSIDFTDSSHGWAVGVMWPVMAASVIHTTDGGTTWVEQPSGAPAPLTAVSAVDADDAWAVGRDGSIVHTVDGGDTWVRQDSKTTNILSAVCFVDSDNGWVSGNAGTILHTTDGGATWTPQLTGTTVALSSLSFSDKMHGWASGSRTVLRTEDGGATWRQQATGATSDIWGIDGGDATHAWAVGDNGMMLHTSTAGGAVCSLAGTVTASGGDPLVGATVKLQDGPSATTASDGSFAIPVVALGTYSLIVSKPGYVSDSQTGVIVATYTVTSIASTLVEGGGSLNGTVAGSVHGPIEGVTVEVVGGPTAKTASDGTFSFLGLPPGTYDVRFSKSGWTSTTTQATISPGGETVVNRELTRAPGSLTGNVSGTEGGVLDGVAVTTSGGQATTTGPDGSFVIQDLPGGRYDLTFTRPDRVTVVIRQLSVSPGATATVSTSLHPAAQMPLDGTKMYGSLSVHGDVWYIFHARKGKTYALGGAMDPVADIYCTVAVCDADGRIVLAGLFDGGTQDFKRYFTPDHDQDLFVRVTPGYTPTPDAHYWVDLLEYDPVVVTGHVTRKPDGQGAPGARVSLYNTTSMPNGLRTSLVATAAADGDGGWSIPVLLPGDYAVTFSDPSGALCPEQYSGQAIDYRYPTAVHVGESSPVAHIDGTLYAPAVLSGTVIDSVKGMLLAGTTVKLTQEHSYGFNPQWDVGTTTTTPDGRFAFGGLDPHFPCLLWSGPVFTFLGPAWHLTPVNFELGSDADVIIDMPDTDSPTTDAQGIPSDWTSETVTVTLEAADIGRGVASTVYSVNDGGETGYSGPFTVSEEGVTTLDFKSTDLAGNVEATQTATVKIDKTAPEITLSPASSYIGVAALDAGGTDELSGLDRIEMRLDSGAWSSATRLNTSALGPHTVFVRAFDAAGNEREASAAFTVLAPPPTQHTTITKVSGASSVVVKKTYKLSGTVNQPLYGYRKVKVVVTRLVNHKYRAYSTTTVTVSGGKFGCSFKPKYRGAYRIQATFLGTTSATNVYKTSKSAAKSIKVR